MPEYIVIKKKLDKHLKKKYLNKSDDSTSVLSDRNTEENTEKVGIKRKEIIDVIKNLDEVKRRLKKALNL